MHFSKSLKEFLTTHAITHTQLSMASGIHRSQISQYANQLKRPSLTTLICISDALEELTKETENEVTSIAIQILFIKALRKDIKKDGFKC